MLQPKAQLSKKLYWFFFYATASVFAFVSIMLHPVCKGLFTICTLKHFVSIVFTEVLLKISFTIRVVITICVSDLLGDYWHV